jgi:hypothetical protein
VLTWALWISPDGVWRICPSGYGVRMRALAKVPLVQTRAAKSARQIPRPFLDQLLAYLVSSLALFKLCDASANRLDGCDCQSPSPIPSATEEA